LPHTLPTHVLGGTQSTPCVLGVHVWLQAVVPLHMKGAQVAVPPPTLQIPAPLHVFASVTIEEPAGQDGGAHGVPAGYLWHCPAPSHLPSLPQVDAMATPHWPLGSGLPAPIGEQVPNVALSVHDTHGPSQTALQQTFCAEQTNPAAHWLVALQAPPFGCRPHEPLRQTALGAQSAFAVQIERHVRVPQL
jgi:hypothetical protein